MLTGLIYIYIYVCVSVCVCMYVCVYVCVCVCVCACVGTINGVLIYRTQNNKWLFEIVREGGTSFLHSVFAKFGN